MSRSSILHKLILPLSLALALSACRGERGRAEGAAPASASARAAARAPSEAPKELVLLARDAAKRALTHLAAWRASPDRLRADHPEYLALRRAIASAAPLWQRRARMGSEVLLGPVRVADESGGALFRLDMALANSDADAALRAASTAERALTLLQEEITRNTVPPDVAAAALSNAAHDLGSLLLESSAGVPQGPEAVLADLRGGLDFLERAAVALVRDAKIEDADTSALGDSIAPLRARLDPARSSLDLEDRASLVMLTGRLGAAIRRLAAAGGLHPKLPYRARVPVRDNALDEPISALTLPAPRTPWPGAEVGPKLADLGKKLFFSKLLSRDGVRACASCHDPARGYADGLASPKSLDPKTPTLRHTPSLLYTSLHAAQLWDGRTLTAEEQALGVIHARAEMGLSSEELVAKLGADASMREAFAAVPSGITPQNVGRALAAFEGRDLVPASAPLDRFARGDEGALSADARAGLDVFAGAGRCARCHIPPFFGGSRPRDFAVPVFAVLGVPESPSGKALDPDRGRALVTKRPLDEHAFKTPTARNVAQTAPYFHNGAYRTLDEVVDFYNRGGGKGLGLGVDNQDPDVRPLKLSKEQIRVLLVFMREALLDAPRK